MNQQKVELTANAAKLLHKLGTDDAVRAAFENNPVATLADYGLELDPNLVPNAVSLPSKQAFQATFDQHIDWLTDPKAQMAFIFTVFFSGSTGSGQGGNG